MSLSRVFGLGMFPAATVALRIRSMPMVGIVIHSTGSSITSSTSQLHTCRRIHTSTITLTSTSSTSSNPTPKQRNRTPLSSSQPPPPECTPTPLPAGNLSFAALHLQPFLCHRLETAGIHRPTRIQAAVIPHAIRRPWDAEGYPDLIVQEMTGQGKTLAYMLPILSTIDRSIAAVQAIIVVPTRELAVQVSRVASELAGNVHQPGVKSMPHPLAVATLVGEANPTMLSSLARSAGFSSPQLLSDEEVDVPIVGQQHPHIIVATPNVLHEIFVQRKMADVHSVLPLTRLKYLVFDEADALLNASSSRNTLVPLIQLRHHAVGLELERVKEEQAKLDATRAERRAAKKRPLDSEDLPQPAWINGNGDAPEQAFSDAVPPKPKEVPEVDDERRKKFEEEERARHAAPASASAPSDSSSSSSVVPPLCGSFPRNQVILVSATVTAAVHQFAARYLGPSRAFLTPESVSESIKKQRKTIEKDGSTASKVHSTTAQDEMKEQEQQPNNDVDSPASNVIDVEGEVVDAPEQTETKSIESKSHSHSPSSSSSNFALHRVPTQIKHYYLLSGRPYDRLNTLQQLLQAIKFSFEAWKKQQLANAVDGGETSSHTALEQGKTIPISPSLLKKLAGPTRALSAGGIASRNQQTKRSTLKGGVSALGLGAEGHWVQNSLVFTERNILPTLVNPLSKQGFQVGVCSEHSGRHERREALRIEKTEVILSTELLARGMDLKSLTHVINYTPPSSSNSYLHRSGRVGRLGALHRKLGGSVITIVDPNDPAQMKELQKVTGNLGLQLKRLYVKKGKLFEDGSTGSVLTQENLPEITTFVAEKEERTKQQSQQSGKQERSQRVVMGKNKPKRGGGGGKKDPRVNETPNAKQSTSESGTAATGSSATGYAHAPPLAQAGKPKSTASLPIDPIAAHLRQGGITPRKLAEIELAPQKPQKKTKKPIEHRA